jgi:hypothetical protein
VRAISLWQPWASAIALGLKRIETRSWSTSYRGWLAIHAAKRWNRELREFSESMGIGLQLPLGAIVAVAHLSGVFPAAVAGWAPSDEERPWGDYSPGRFAWMLTDIRPLPEPIPFRGAQGFFVVPNEVLGLPPEPSRQAVLL